MADFAADGAKGGLLFGELSLQKFFSVFDLACDDAGAGLPGKREPSEERWALALGRPIFAFQRGRYTSIPTNRTAGPSSAKSGLAREDSVKTKRRGKMPG